MQRLQHKTPLRHARVRHCQPVVRYDCRAMEQQVEVDPSWAPESRADAAENIGFDPEEPFQQIMGGKRRVKPQDGIVERWLFGNTYGRGLIK